MKKLFLLPILLFFGCQKDTSTSNSPNTPVTTHTVTTSPDTITYFLNIPSSGNYWVSDSIYPGYEGNWNFVAEQYFFHPDSLPLSVNYSGDSAIPYVFYNKSWVLLQAEPSTNILMTDTMYGQFSEWYKDQRTVMNFYYKSKVFNGGLYPTDTIHLKVFVKPQ